MKNTYIINFKTLVKSPNKSYYSTCLFYSLNELNDAPYEILQLRNKIFTVCESNFSSDQKCTSGYIEHLF